MARKKSTVKPVSHAADRDREIDTPSDTAAAAVLADICPRYTELAAWHIAEIIYRQMENVGDTENAAYKLKVRTFPANGLPSAAQVKAFLGAFAAAYDDAATRKLFNGWRPELEPLSINVLPTIAELFNTAHSTLILCLGGRDRKIIYCRQPTLGGLFAAAELRISQGATKESVLEKLDAWRSAVENHWDSLIENESGEIPAEAARATPTSKATKK